MCATKVYAINDKNIMKKYFVICDNVLHISLKNLIVNCLSMSMSME